MSSSDQAFLFFLTKISSHHILICLLLFELLPSPYLFLSPIFPFPIFLPPSPFPFHVVNLHRVSQSIFSWKNLPLTLTFFQARSFVCLLAKLLQTHLFLHARAKLSLYPSYLFLWTPESDPLYSTHVFNLECRSPRGRQTHSWTMQWSPASWIC